MNAYFTRVTSVCTMQESEDTCVICANGIGHARDKVTLTEKDCITIDSISDTFGEDVYMPNQATTSMLSPDFGIQAKTMFLRKLQMRTRWHYHERHGHMPSHSACGQPHLEQNQAPVLPGDQNQTSGIQCPPRKLI